MMDTNCQAHIIYDIYIYIYTSISYKQHNDVRGQIHIIVCNEEHNAITSTCAYWKDGRRERQYNNNLI